MILSNPDVHWLFPTGVTDLYSVEVYHKPLQLTDGKTDVIKIEYSLSTVAAKVDNYA